MKPMETIRSEDVKEGMRFSAPVFFDDGKNMFLAEKKPVTPFHLSVLSRWSVPYIVTYGKPLGSDPGIEDEAEELEAVSEVEEAEELEELEKDTFSFSNIVRKKLTDVSSWKFYSKAVKNIQKFFADYKEKRTADKALIDDSIKLLYKLVTDDKNFALTCVCCKFEKTPFYPLAAIDTAVLSAVLAQEMSLPPRALVHCISAAFLHSLEMADYAALLVKAPASVQKNAVLNVNENELLRECVQKTVNFAAGTLMYPREVISAFSQRYERWDGTGSPEGRKAQEIDQGARVLAVCCNFYSMITPEPAGAGMLAYDAVKKLLDEKDKKFDSGVLKAFVRAVGLYPPGTFVLLNDSSIAQVVSNNPDAPFVPSVQIIKSSSAGDDKTGKLIDLNGEKSMLIVRAINPEEDKNSVNR